MTSKAEDYRRRAQACLVMAATIASDETRASFVEMAQVWTRLADEQDEQEALVSPRTVADSPLVAQQQQQQQQQIQPKKKEE